MRRNRCFYECNDELKHHVFPVRDVNKRSSFSHIYSNSLSIDLTNTHKLYSPLPQKLLL